MSLVGSLEDLGLVDILQIVSLSRKSGMLMLRSESGEGRIVLRDGLVQGAAVKGEVEDLRSLLIHEGCVDAGAFEQAEALAASESIGIDDALGRACGLDADRLERLRRDHVERSVMRMFGWRAGEFQFEIREDPGEQASGLMLVSGLNTQYLAMEATRLGDEAGQPEDDASASDEDDGAMMFSGESVPETAVDALAEVAIDAVVRESPDEADPGDVAIDAPAVGKRRVPVSVSAPVPPGTLVAVDSDLSALEWLKASVDGVFQRVHIFQRRDAALVRIRQYLVRGTVPMVVMADAPADRRGPDAENFAERLRSLAPKIAILALCPENAPGAVPASVDGVLRRPTSPSPDRDRWHLYEGIAAQLRRDVAPWLAGEQAVLARRQARGVLSRLESLSDRRRDPATQGEALELVLDYAAETFGRVALFVLRDGLAVGLAQRGMPASGGPDDEAIRGIDFDPDAMPQLFRDVLDQRVPVGRSPQSESDRQLLQHFGASVPAEVYAAPLESGGVVVAIVYADDAPDEKPLPDPTPFEIVLHEAGLVLDRALLGRALADRDDPAAMGA